jgi:hypothetical protein
VHGKQRLAACVRDTVLREALPPAVAQRMEMMIIAALSLYVTLEPCLMWRRRRSGLWIANALSMQR